MARKQTIQETKKEEVKDLLPKTKQPLVFISHDTRDAELAEEFSNLLKSASAGGLKSFRSSDKKGTQGIEYGSEWYPAIMEKIDEASDVVCLLTENSVDRPWILYEAGVAKGKLNKKVIGLALGIPLSAAINGPFAQFQNNNGDAEAITKLVLELVNKVPGLEQEHQIVKPFAEAFLKKAQEIIAKIKTENSADTKKDTPDENSVAKLFEEVKIMFDDLPSRIENRVQPDYKRRSRKFHPMMVDELIHFGLKSEDPNLSFLMLVSFFKEDFPWLYEIGVDTYRTLKTSKSKVERQKAISNFERAFEMFGHPMMKEFYGRNEDTYIFYKEFRHIMHRYFDRYFKSDLGDKE